MVPISEAPTSLMVGAERWFLAVSRYRPGGIAPRIWCRLMRNAGASIIYSIIGHVGGLARSAPPLSYLFCL